MRMRAIGAVLLATSLAACDSKQLQITNPNSVTVDAAAKDPAALQLLATGLLSDYRSDRGSLIQNSAVFGREGYYYFPTDARYTQNGLIGIVVGGQQVLDPAGFYAGDFATEYNTLRNLYNFKTTVSAATTLSTTQKAAALGFAKTLEAETLYELLWTRDSLGAVVEIKADAAALAPFVSRDSTYKYIMATFDDAATQLAAGGSAFPFTLHSGFTGFNTPATFATYTQALKARAAVNWAASTNSATAWGLAATALSKSYLNTAASSRAALDVGVYHIYSAAASDQTNGLNFTTNQDLYAHMSFQTDVTNKGDGTPDNRYAAKLVTGALRQAPQNLGVSSSLRFSLYPTPASSIASIRNEELIGLDAEVKLATGNAAGAIADINVLRTVSGGLAPSTLTAASSSSAILHGILYEKRYSNMLEGIRWVDMRKYNLLSELPLDISSGVNKHFVAKVIPIPQAECLSRAGKGAALAGPGC